MRQPLRKMGKSAAETVLRRIARDGAEHPKEITVEPELVVRESTREVGPVNASRMPAQR